MESASDSSHDLGTVDFLIVTALPEERDAILRLLEGYRYIEIGESFVCYISTLPTNSPDANYTIAVVKLSQMGNVEAGIHTTRAINALKPSCVLMVGIAAGVKSETNLGDVIVSTQIIYYEQAKQTSDGLRYRPISIPADPFLLSSAQNYNNINWHDLIVVERPKQKRRGSASSNTPRVHFGPFAAGDKVIASQVATAALMHFHSKLIGIEMESYGVATAAANSPSRPRFLAIRGVSDFADEDKNDDWREYAAASVAAFSIGFLRYGLIPSHTLHAKNIATAPRQAGSLIAVRHLSMQHIPPESIINSLPPRFTGFSVIELLVDQTDFYHNGQLVDPLKAAERQADLDQHIDNLLASYPHSSVAYFGIAHIPLLFHLGYRLSNKRKLHFFELNRYTGHWEYLHGETDGPELKVDGLPIQLNEEAGDVLIRISISNTVRLEEVMSIVPSPLASIHLRIEPPKRDVMVSEHQLHNYGAKFRWVLDTVHEFLPNRKRVHIFYAGPVSLAVYFGQLISPTIDCRVVVYNYTMKDFPRYSWGLQITEETTSNDFLVEVQKLG